MAANSKKVSFAVLRYDYFKANMSRVSSMAKVTDHDYHLHIVEMQSTGPTNNITFCSFITFCSGLMGRPIQSQRMERLIRQI